MRKFLTAGDPFGSINPVIPGTNAADPVTDLVKVLNVGLNIVMVIAGLYALMQFLLAGYYYVTSAGDTKKVSQANSSITFAFIGLLIIVFTPVLAALIGIIVFKRWDAILRPDVKTF